MFFVFFERIEDIMLVNRIFLLSKNMLPEITTSTYDFKGNHSCNCDVMLSYPDTRFARQQHEIAT